VTTSVLSDGTIRRLVGEGRIKIDPWDPGLVQPASVDLRLGTSFRVFHNHRIKAVDLAAPPSGLTELVEVPQGGEFVIHPTEFVLGRTAEAVELPDDVVARIEGKALALDTPVPTPRGWTTMGELEVGTEVFDAWGMPTEVTAATGVMHGRECRELVFSDGTTIVADVDHLWESWTKRSRAARRPPEILTTRAIEQTLKAGQKEYNHHVAQCDPVQYQEKDLPVDPYVFGAWIGDGTSTQADLTSADPPILREIALAGYAVEHRAHRTGRFTAKASLHNRLRAMGALGDKHIPNAYLQGSVRQRQDLLEGLMDTDGYVDRWGRCELTTVRRHLADQYRELIASLGFKPVVSVKTATLNGKDCGLRYDVTFTPDEPVRAIVEVRRVPSAAVRCIQVAHPRGLFLVSRSFIPTHNSSLGRLGLIVHATAGFVDPGFQGSLTLEITNFNSVPIVLRPGLPIAQLSFMALDRPAERPYGHPDLGSHYHGQTEATESRYEGGPARPR
jgi:deoxycytidine triphosphate deaminase